MATVTILDSNSDLGRICRLCLASNKKLCNIFETDSESTEWTVADKILDSTSLHVQEEDGLPSHICSVCRTLLDAFHRFKRKCITSDQTLRNYLWRMDPNIQVKSDEVSAEELEDVDEKSKDLIAIQANGSRSPAFNWSSEAMDVEVKVEITEADPTESDPTESDPHNTKAPIKRKYRRIDGGSANLKGLYPCSQCNKKFFHKNSLTRHEFIHSNEKFECSFCKKTLSTRDTLIRHVKAHVGQKAYTCQTCGKQYTSNTSYLAHIRKHTGERPYQCGECKESFSLSSSLARHIAKKHKKEKSFVCDLCGAAFWVYDDLRSHVNRVH